VSSFTFPNVTTATIGYDTTCSGSKPAEEVYSLPVVPTSTSTSAYTPFTYTTTGSGGGKTTSTYQVTASSGSSSDPDANGFSSDYFSPGATNNLNSSSILVKAVGDGTTNGCLTVPATNNNIDFGSGGVTYFASAIYAAQTALQAEKSYVDGLDSKATPSKNAIIFVSDGQANTQSGVYPQAEERFSFTYHCRAHHTHWNRGLSRLHTGLPAGDHGVAGCPNPGNQVLRCGLRL
jgi:hypothetical protein